MNDATRPAIDYRTLAIAAFDSSAHQFNANPTTGAWRILEAAAYFRQNPGSDTLQVLLEAGE